MLARLALLAPFAAAAPMALLPDSAGTNSTQASQQSSASSDPPNLIVVTIPKTGSLTPGIARRLAAQRGLNGASSDTKKDFIKTEPGIGFTGTFSKVEEKVKALKSPVFKMTVVSDPVARCLSMFYHVNISLPDGPPVTQFGNTVEAKLKYMRYRCANFQFNSIKMRAQETVEEVWNSYDVIGAGPERLKETAVLVSKRFGHGANIGDVLALDAGLESPEQLKAHNPDRYRDIPALEDEPKEIQDYAKGEFKQHSAKDFELFRRANAQIEHFLAQQENAEAVQVFNDLHTTAKERCHKKEFCPNGRITMCEGCYFKDAGCGYQCINQMLGVAVSPPPTAAWTWDAEDSNSTSP